VRSPRPPFLARAILRVRMSGPMCDAIEGDLEERYSNDRERLGSLRAGFRYWRDALSPSLAAANRELASKEARPLPRSNNRASVVGELARDLKHTGRLLVKSPGFSLIAILSLALGIGPNTAIFSMVNATVLRGPEGSNPAQLVDVYNEAQNGRWYYSAFSLVERLREGTGDVFDGVAAWVLKSGAVEEDEIPRPMFYELVTGNYFDVLGIRPERGRFFLPEEDLTPGTHPVVVVSHPYWQARMAADPQVVGSEVRVNGRPYTVVGVAPEGFTGKAVPGAQSDLWIPYNMYPHLAPGQPGIDNLGITARISENVEMATALASVNAVSARIDADRKADGSNVDFVARAFPWESMYLHPDMDGPLLAIAGLLMAVVGLVLIVTCVNLAGFFLTKAIDRRREVAMRLALGATQGAIVRQFVLEAAVLGIGGGVLGLALGIWTARALMSIEFPVELPLSVDVGLDPRVLLFTLGASILAALMFGLAPALQASRSPVAGVLRDEAGSVTGGRRAVSLRNSLVAAQMALSVVLLVAAGLFIRSLGQATSIDPGFDTGPAAIVQVTGETTEYDDAEFLQVLQRVMEDLEAEPQIRSAAVVTRMPLDLGVYVSFYDIPGVAPPQGRDNHRIERTEVTPEYLEMMDIQLLEGRGIEASDDADAPPIVVVSKALADRIWPGSSAIGKTLIPRRNPEAPVTVVGVVEDVKIWTLQEAPRPYMYRPFAQNPSTYALIVAKGTQAPERLGQTVVDALRRVDRKIFIPEVSTMGGHLSFILFLPRMAARLIGGFALLALALSSIGLYGVVSHGVARRTKEVGIRLSLGASAWSVVRSVIRHGVTLAVAGALVGTITVLVLVGFLRDYLIGISPWDPATLVGVPVLLIVIAALAAYLPARRASRVDPVKALRYE
jgi:predicted permease